MEILAGHYWFMQLYLIACISETESSEQYDIIYKVDK